ncbi:MAG: hypothetical protein WD739_09435 [Actinomycetota bacterium]
MHDDDEIAEVEDLAELTLADVREAQMGVLHCLLVVVASGLLRQAGRLRERAEVRDLERSLR